MLCAFRKQPDACLFNKKNERTKKDASSHKQESM